MNFRPVRIEDYGFLYELLEKRPPMANITHKEMPSWEDHVDFNDRKPYKEDYIIENDGQPYGRLYITKDNKVGVSTLDGSEELVIQHLIMTRKDLDKLQFEVSPRNKHLQATLKRNNYELIHHTFAWVDQTK